MLHALQDWTNHGQHVLPGIGEANLFTMSAQKATAKVLLQSLHRVTNG